MTDWLSRLEKKVECYNNQYDGLLDGNPHEMRDEQRAVRVLREMAATLAIAEQRGFTPLLSGDAYTLLELARK